MGPVTDQLAALPTMSSAQLRAEWMKVYRDIPPPLTADLLRRGIAYRLQERASGGLPPATVRAIERLRRAYARTGAAVPTAPVTIKPGTRLVREWGGSSHHVLVVDGGFLYRERQYRSLSQIASEITGTRWSGPRFFGLKAASNA